ncbi:CUB domain protein, partial [Opisthorchis viverrini]
MFRLPNQSAICNDFIQTFYLDKSSPDIALPNRPFWDVAALSRWPDRRPNKLPSNAPALPSSGSKVPERFPSSPLKFDSYFDKGMKDLKPLLYTFTSPAYPNNYPPQTDCIKVIRAPDKNQRILLDFRGEFQLEPSTGCVNDYLEVRDGEFGFSPLIGRFCIDSWFLHSIVSTGPWVWLRFHSDFSIEKRGFQAVFYYGETTDDGELVIAKTVLSFDVGGVFDQRNLSLLLQSTLRSSSKSKSWMAARLREVIIDFRTRDPTSRLLLHLSYIKFPFIDTQCKYNFIEVYEQFFLTDRLEVHPGTKTSARGRFSVSSLHVPKVIRACNKPYLNPITHTLGRGVVRLLSSSYQMLQETDEMVLLQTVRDEGPAGEADVTLSLPELTLVYTELGKAPCKLGWVPCMKMEDLRMYQDKLNASGLSVGEVLTPKPGKLTKYTTDQLSGLNLDGILCVAEKLLCDNHTNCPNGEDEDECPRAIGDLDRVLTHQANNEDESALTTTIVASVNEKSSADDEFPHHTWIIVGLLGFCAMCGMLSAGVTLVKRAKKTKQGSMSGMCNKVFFESESSIMTTLEGGTALRLQTGNNESPMKLQNSGVDGNVPMGPCTGPLVETATCADDVFKKDAGWCSSSCLTKQDRSHGSSERKARRSRSLPNSKNDEPHQNCKKESGELKSDDNRTDRNSRISVNGKRSPSSPVLDRIKSSQSSVSNFLRLPRDFEESESCLMSQGSRRSTAASFGNLPNTVVFPVEKLSDVVYHCTDPKGLALNRAWWNRSVPLPLVAESGARIIQGQCPSERIQETHSAKCLSGFSHSEQRGETNEMQRVEIPLHPHANLQRNFGTTYPPNPSDTHVTSAMGPKYFTVSGNDSDKWNTGELKQKHFRGGAPKRPRYSIDPVNEPHTSGETDTVGKIFTYRGRPINATHATKASVWTSSFSTSGELVDDSQPDSHSLPQKSTGYRLREPSGNWAYSYQRAAHLAAEEWGKVIEPDSDSSNTRLKLSSYNVDEDKLISRGVHHHHRCPTSETIPNALVSVQCDKTKRISDTINPILTHGRALPCNCRFGGTKFAFPSSLSVTDQKTLERRHRMSDRKTSLDDFRVNQCDESETASSQQNSEDTETESRSEDRQ